MRVARGVLASRTRGVAAALCLAACAATSVAAPIDAPAASVDQVSVDHVSVDPAAVDRAASLASTCSGCHRAGGSAIVDLHAYSALRIEQLLLAYKQAPDGPTAMHRMARGYSDAEIASIARRLGGRGR